MNISAVSLRELVTRAHHATGRGPLMVSLGLALVFTGAQVTAPPPAAADPAPGHLVINEISGGNGTGTAATDEYVELYNPTDATITFTGTVQYKSATGATYAVSSPVFTAVVPTHGYYLVAGVNYSGAAAPDARYTFDMSASTTAGGHIALTGATAAGTSPTNDPLRVDLVGWGTANVPETTAAPSHPPAGGSLSRTNGVDTDNNSVDFTQRAVRSPRSSAQNDAVTLSNPGTQVYPVDQPIEPVAVTAAGGRSPYTYAISSGSLPAGLTLGSSTGEISGTPTSTRAAENVTVRATDGNGDPVYSTFSVAVVDGGAAPLTLASPGSKTFVFDTPITPFTISASGGVGPYTYAVTAGSFPDGITLDRGTGEVSGTPASGGSFVVDVTVTDSASATATASFAVDVDLGTLATRAATIDDTTPVVGQILTATVDPWGPDPVALSYQWLADGEEIALETSNDLEVTPVLVGTKISVRVTGHKAGYDEASTESAQTADVVAPVTVTNPGDQNLYVGVRFTSFTIAASGGRAPYSYDIASGALPDGVGLDPDTGEISGTPVAETTASNVTITVTDADGNTGSTTFAIRADLSSLTTAVPTIDDTTPVVGDTLTADAGTWGPAPVDLAYQWLADGDEIEDAIGASLDVTGDLVGADLSVRVTGTKAAYRSASAVSDPTSAVVVPVTVASPGAKRFTVGVPVTPFTLNASGGVAPYTYVVTTGALPTGVTLDRDTGQVSGTPTAASSASNVEVTATDADDNTGSTTFSVTVDAAPSTGGPGPGPGGPQPTPVTPTPVTPAPATPAPVKPAPVKPDVDIRMEPVDRRPEHRVRLRILVDGAAVTGTVRVQVGDRRVSAHAVDGIVRLTPAQITKLVVKPKAPGATPPKPPTTGTPTPAAQPRPKYRQVRAVVRYLGNPAAPVSAPFTIRVKRLHP
ncbi:MULTISPECIES: putative Ig domain-containing protein [unclassified Nocardioides]|uniref:putative Ig domain-containing protein n=1 Tax=unclassified Nocardioides TaxID=2615069 RepID=UPI0036110F0F